MESSYPLPPEPSKTALETEAAAAPAPCRNNTLSMVDLTLRLLLFATTLTSVVVMVASKQTKLVTIPFLPAPVPFKAKFTDSPAIILPQQGLKRFFRGCRYFVAALSVACLYSLLSSVASVFAVSNPSVRQLLVLSLIDTVMAGVVASATGAVSSIAYVAWRGNSHVRWDKVCNIFDKFCDHVASSIIISLICSIILVLLVMVSTYSLYLKSHK